MALEHIAAKREGRCQKDAARQAARAFRATGLEEVPETMGGLARSGTEWRAMSGFQEWSIDMDPLDPDSPPDLEPNQEEADETSRGPGGELEELLVQASYAHRQQVACLRAEIGRLRAALGAKARAAPDAYEVKAGFEATSAGPPCEYAWEGRGSGSRLSSKGSYPAGTTSAAPGHKGESDVPHDNHPGHRALVKHASIMGSSRDLLPRANSVLLAHIERWVSHPWFEVFFMSCILLNSLLLAIEAEYNGYVVGFETFGWREPEDTWHHASASLPIMEYVFGTIFCIECVLKLIVYKRRFLLSAWNVFDLVVVVFWILEQASTVLPIPTLVLRLARLTKMMRLVRLTRTVEFADTLNLITVALRHSLSATVWSLCLLSLISMLLALCMNYGTKAYVENPDIDEERRMEIFMYFGTFWRSVLSVLEITVGNWVPVTRMLQEYISSWLAVAAVIYRLLMEVAVLKVVAGVFLHETFRVTKTDSELMIRGAMREEKVFKEKIANLFAEVDTNHDGTLSKDEFVHIFSNDRAGLYLRALGLEYTDCEGLWQLVQSELPKNSQHDEITTHDLEKVLKRIRGTGRSLDVVMALQKIERISEALGREDAKLNQLGKQLTKSGLSLEKEEVLTSNDEPSDSS